MADASPTAVVLPCEDTRMIDIPAAERAVYQWVREWESDPMTAHDVAFHLCDWLSDLDELSTVLANPEHHTSEQARDAVLGFLIHAPAHIAAAAKLFLDQPVRDVFEIGAVQCRHEDA